MPPPQDKNAAQSTAAAPKYAPPPSSLPLYQRVDPKTVSFFGRTSFDVATDSKKLIFGLKRVDRARHVYMLGKSGSGKTKTQELFIRQDIAYGFGCCVIDPRGDLVRDVLAFIPSERAKDVMVLDAADDEFSFLWNPLSDIPESLRHRYAQGLLEVFELQLGSAWGSRIEHLLRTVLLTLLDYPHATLRSIAPLLTDETFRKEVTGYVRDAGLRQFWDHEYAVWEERFSSDAILPIVSMIREILSDPTLSAVFGSGESRVQLRDVFAHERVVLVNLARAKLGNKDARFLGALLITALSVVAMHEGAQGNRKRPFYLYLDDVLESITPSCELLISESKQNLVHVTLGQQFASELSTALKRFLLGNMGSIISFRTNPDDALWLEPEFAPILKAKDLSMLPARVFAVKMTIDGNTQDPFLAETLDVHPSDHVAQVKELLSASRDAYAKSNIDIAAAMKESDKKFTGTREAASVMEGEMRIPIPRKISPPSTPAPKVPTNKSDATPDAEGALTREFQE